MWTISEVKETGKAAFRGNYWPCVLVALLMGIFTGGGSVANSAQQTAAASILLSPAMFLFITPYSPYIRSGIIPLSQSPLPGCPPAPCR